MSMETVTIYISFVNLLTICDCGDIVAADVPFIDCHNLVDKYELYVNYGQISYVLIALSSTFSYPKVRSHDILSGGS